MSNTEHRELIKSLHPEAVSAYTDEIATDALKHSDWFTSDFIEKVNASEPFPEREGLGPFKDKLLGDFFLAETQLGKGNEVYLGARTFIYQRMVGGQGHPFPLKEIPFTDEKVLEIAKKLGVNENYEVGREKIGEIGSMLQCIVAAEKIRNKVVRVTCRWGNERVKRDTLLWAELVKKGTKDYLQSRES